MRISTDWNDPGYPACIAAIHQRQTVRVYLDGADVSRYCSTADDVEGFVKRAVLDDQGRIQIDPNNPDQVWEEIIKGDVRIEFA